MEQTNKNLLLRKIPSLEKLISEKNFLPFFENYPRRLILDSARKNIEILREKIIKSQEIKSMEKDNLNEIIHNMVKNDLEKWEKQGLKRVINATGVILHTNLGRAPLGKKARGRINSILKSYCSLEVDIETGKRGGRHTRVEELLKDLTGAEGAVVVNNDSAAVFLVLHVLAAGKEVIVSRGELVEIGGGFRIPEVMKRSGCHLVEVGTTNKTRLADYEHAINENTAMLLKVHTSNFKIIGFTESASLEEMVDLSNRKKIPFFYDQGNGLMVDLNKFGIHCEKNILDAIKTGVDIIAFSGDKLLGGPQAGIIAGKKKYIDIIKKDDMIRSLRVDKIVLGALEATLEEYLTGKPEETIPVIQMIAMSQNELKNRACKILSNLSHIKTATIGVSRSESKIGGGTFPGYSLPTYVISIDLAAGATELQEKLRLQEPAIYSKVEDSKVMLDLRTVMTDELEELEKGIKKALK